MRHLIVDGPIARSLPKVIPNIRSRAMPQQQPNDLHVPARDGIVQRRMAFLALQINFRSAFQQSFDFVCSATDASRVQRGVSIGSFTLVHAHQPSMVFVHIANEDLVGR